MIAKANSFHCTAFRVGFRLTANSELLLSAMLQCAPFGAQVCARPSASTYYPSFALAKSPGRPDYCLIVDDQVIAESKELQSLLDHLTRSLMVHVANYAPDRVFLHAGVVGWQGHALVLPGASLAGKSTLVAELVRAGATYYSDEYAVLDERGFVHPYPRDLQIRRPGSPEQSSMCVEQLDGIVGTTPLRVSRVVLTQYRASAHWQPEPLSAGMAVLEMLQHAIPVQRTPARVMSTLTRMIETATAVRSERGEANAAAHALLAELTRNDPNL
jgi:serine kinase of HPr protein (carbohydrate metabolism regulator)